jgi:hypothetical protein
MFNSQSAMTRLWLSAACILVVIGCGQRGPETVPVDGKITFGGRECPAAGVIYFVPTSAPAGLPRRPASATFDKDGRFRVTSFQPGDGLLPGSYSVRIECWRQRPSEMSKGISYVPVGYTPPEVTIEQGTRGPRTLTFDVPRAAEKR